jgi:capsular exopolysaccharide synthesis family protein
MEEIDIKEFLRYIKKFLIPMIIVSTLAVGGVVCYDINIKKPMYKTSTTVVLAQSNDKNITSQATLNDVNLNQKLVATYTEIVKSKLVLQQAIDELGLETSVNDLAKHVTVTAVEDTEILKITVEDGNKEIAAQIANKIADIFTKEIKNIYKLENVSALDVAQTPEGVSNNTTIRDSVIAFLISVFGISAIAFIVYYFDDTLKYNDELERKIKMPIAGKIVKSEFNPKKDSELIVERYPKSIISESIKTLRTNLQFSNVDKGFKTILITSANAGEGKSFIASNLAISFAQANKKTLLIDCDLRKGRLHKLFELPNIQGFSTMLTDVIANSKKYINKTRIKNLDVITRGCYPPNPSELLSSKKFKEVVDYLKGKYDIIIFDGAPCNGVTDSVIISTVADETILVAYENKTTKSTLDAAHESLKKVNSHITGLVLNGMNRKVAKYYSYYGENK